MWKTGLNIQEKSNGETQDLSSHRTFVHNLSTGVVAEKLYRSCVLVFNDDFKNRSSAQENAQPIYEIIMAKRMGIFDCGWKFIDFGSNEFFWRISGWNSSWTLTDVGGRVVAKFSRAGFRMSKLGVLEVMEDVKEPMLTLILLTCKLVHKSVQESEQSSGGGP
ncbi:hypothetical protein GGI03_006446 [Coemansia sp. RSA 2337]|nr:hypothetical protein GGI03_006446 [Coemansia sp. RSA 2337]